MGSTPHIGKQSFLRTEGLTMSDENVMTIREMCDSFGVTPRTLRFYEQKELLFPIREGQKRLYTRRDRARLKLILRGKRFGFSLEEIRQLLDLYHLGDQQQTQILRTYEIARERLADMERQRDELNTAIADLRDQMKWAEKMIATVNMPKKAAE
jgi:DNA-binding transcriptional MerR regulator